MSDFRTKERGRKPRPLSGEALRRSQMTHCINGHEYTSENTCLYNGRRSCRTCRYERARKWCAKNVEKKREINRRSHRKYHFQENKYGLTPQQYEDLVKEQNGVCAICGLPEREGKRLSVDHDHITGKVRGLLCDSCNVGLGRFKDNPITIRAAFEYLENAALSEISRLAAAESEVHASSCQEKK